MPGLRADRDPASLSLAFGQALFPNPDMVKRIVHAYIRQIAFKGHSFTPLQVEIDVVSTSSQLESLHEAISHFPFFKAAQL
jgi:hypothetical protein